ncbi:MAG: hypothetical protein AB4040_01685 [Synechococcus sp.]
MVQSFPFTEHESTEVSCTRNESRTSIGAGTIAKLTVIVQNRTYRITGLVTDGAFGGCGLVVVTQAPLKAELSCSLMMGREGPIDARIAWARVLDSQVWRLGLQYLD